jgi:tetratricopeptide (TPR) repeat protein
MASHSLSGLHISPAEFLAIHGANYDLNDDVRTATVFRMLSINFRARFTSEDDLGALDNAIYSAQQAAILTSDSDADKLDRLESLSRLHQTRAQRLGIAHDYTEAVDAAQRAVDLSTPDGDPDTAYYLNDLSISYQIRFERFGNVDDLTHALSAVQRAVDLTRDDQADIRRLLNSLALAYRARFEHTGDLRDLAQAISVGQRAVDLTPIDHPDIAGLFNNLSLSLQARFQRVGDLGDISQAVLTGKQAVDHTRIGDRDYPGLLNNLGLAHRARFERSGELDDIAQAISVTQRSLEQTPDGHPNHAMYRNNLGAVLRIRFERLGNHDDITEAISACQLAVDLIPDDHSNKPACLDNLGLTFTSRFRRSGDIVDFERATSACERAVNLSPDGHPDKADYNRNLGQTFHAEHQRSGDQASLARALHHFRIASVDVTGKPRTRFLAALEWGSLASLSRDTFSPIPAFEQLVSVIPLLVTLDRPVERRFADVAREIGGAVNVAAAAAISNGRPDLAMEWLEAGRSIVWDQLSQLRTPINALRSVHPKLADKFESLSSALQSPVREKSQDTTNREDSMLYRLGLARDFESLLAEIRALHGFEAFLLPRKLSQLASAVSSLDGPVIVINMHHSRCDALVLSPREALRHVALPGLSVKLAKRMHSLLHRTLAVGRGSRQSKVEHELNRAINVPGTGLTFNKILSSLWRFVVQPILEPIEDIVSTSSFYYRVVCNEHRFTALGYRHEPKAACYMVSHGTSRIPAYPRGRRIRRRFRYERVRFCRFLVHAVFICSNARFVAQRRTQRSAQAPGRIPSPLTPSS